MDKKRKYTIVTLLGAALSIAAVIYFSPMQYLITGYGKLDSDLKHIITTITIAGLALTLFVTRHLKIKEEQLEQIEAWDLSVMIVIPSAEGFAYIMKIPTNYPWAILVYFVGVMVWFLLVICRHKIFKDPKEEKKFTFSVAYTMFVFAAFGILAFWEIVSLLPYMKPVGH